MRNLLFPFVILLLAASACVKNSSNIIPVAAGLKSQFSYKPGSYWVYTDSVSGEQDSAYVVSNNTSYVVEGCVLEADGPKTEYISIVLAVNNGNASDSEKWYLTLKDSTCSISFMNSRDSIGSRLFFTLFKYPIALGNIFGVSGCVPVPDNGSITDIIPEQSVGGQTYQDAARSTHSNDTAAHGIVLQYNDCFYVNNQAGLIELVFDHQQDAVYRVLKLQQYHIVR